MCPLSNLRSTLGCDYYYAKADPYIVFSKVALLNTMNTVQLYSVSLGSLTETLNLSQNLATRPVQNQDKPIACQRAMRMEATTRRNNSTPMFLVFSGTLIATRCSESPKSPALVTLEGSCRKKWRRTQFHEPWDLICVGPP